MGKKPQSVRSRSPYRLLWGGVIIAAASATAGAALGMLFAFAPLKPAQSSAGNGVLDPTAPMTILPATLARPVNILVLGIDNSGHPHQANFTPAQAMAGNSDTMLLVRIYPDGRIHVLSIPRDTQVQIPGLGVAKVNAANGAGGPRLAAQTVSQLLDGVQIDRYLRIDTQGLIQMVDALGSVQVDVPEAMHYTDNIQHLYIDFEPGVQSMDGQRLEEYIRFRHDPLGDIGRVQRQEEVMRALLAKMLQPQTLERLPALLQVVKQNVDTDLSVGEMLAVLQVAIHTHLHNLELTMLPGRFSSYRVSPISYWLCNYKATAGVMQRFFDLPLGVAPVSLTPSQVTVGVENGANQPGLAEKTVQWLRSQGFTQAYRSDHDVDNLTNGHTTVIGAKANPAQANLVRQTLGVGRVQIASTGDLSADVTVVAGPDLTALLDRPTPTGSPTHP